MGKRIISIGRQSGSGGREIGTKLAQALGVPCYDKSLIALASRESGIHPSILEQYDEKSVNRFLYTVPAEVNSSTGFGLPISDTLFFAQSNVILELAKKESCVIIGRCADYILRDNPDCISVFIHAPLEYRIERTQKSRELSYEDAKNYVKVTDKKRKSYYNFYTENKWGNMENFHLCINSSLLGIDGTVKVLKELIDLKK